MVIIYYLQNTNINKCVLHDKQLLIQWPTDMISAFRYFNWDCVMLESIKLKNKSFETKKWFTLNLFVSKQMNSVIRQRNWVIFKPWIRSMMKRTFVFHAIILRSNGAIVSNYINLNALYFKPDLLKFHHLKYVNETVRSCQHKLLHAPAHVQAIVYIYSI